MTFFGLDVPGVLRRLEELAIRDAKCTPKAFAWRRAAMMLREAIEQPWQDEPLDDGWHWIRGPGKAERVAFVRRRGDKWVVDGAGGARPLKGRRVCRIAPPPALEGGVAS